MAEDYYKKKITDYLKRNSKKGYSMETLKWALINQGYSRIIVENAIEDVSMEMARDAPKLDEKPRIKYEILDENNNPIKIKKPWWKRIFG